jgi:DNA-binding CsgD family transcriptional regulator
MAVAQMLFDEADCLWHLHSSGDFLHSKRLHPLPGDQAHLIAIPVVWWSPVSPALLELGDVEDPFRAVERLRLLRLDETMEQSRAFVLGSLSPAEERAVSLLVREGLSDAEIAGRLVISPRTVEHHLREAYRKAALHWGAGDINRAQLVALLNFYYKLRENPHDRREKSR